MKFKSKNGQEYIIPGIGQTINSIIDAPVDFENPNFERITDEPVAPAAPASQPVAPTPPAPANKENQQ